MSQGDWQGLFKIVESVAGHFVQFFHLPGIVRMAARLEGQETKFEVGQVYSENWHVKQLLTILNLLLPKLHWNQREETTLETLQ